MKAIWSIILIGIGIWVFLFWKGCKSDAQVKILSDSVSVQKKVSDSLKKEVDIRDKKVDSVNKKNSSDSLKYCSKIDSLTKENAKLKGKFYITRDSIVKLYNRLQFEVETHDTSDIFNTVDSLRNQLSNADAQLFQWQTNRDSLDFIKDQEIERLRGVISELQKQILGFKAAFDAEFKSHQAVTNDFFKLEKREKFESLLLKIAPGLIALLAAGIFIHK